MGFSALNKPPHGIDDVLPCRDLTGVAFRVIGQDVDIFAIVAVPPYRPKI